MLFANCEQVNQLTKLGVYQFRYPSFSRPQALCSTSELASPWPPLRRQPSTFTPSRPHPPLNLPTGIRASPMAHIARRCCRHLGKSSHSRAFRSDHGMTPACHLRPGNKQPDMLQPYRFARGRQVRVNQTGCSHPRRRNSRLGYEKSSDSLPARFHCLSVGAGRQLAHRDLYRGCCFRQLGPMGVVW